MVNRWFGVGQFLSGAMGQLYPGGDTFKLDIEIQGCFAWDDMLDKDTEQLDTLLRQNAPAALFSYLRPIVTQITVEANIPPLVLPLMNFTEKEQ